MHRYDLQIAANLIHQEPQCETLRPREPLCESPFAYGSTRHLSLAATRETWRGEVVRE